MVDQHQVTYNLATWSANQRGELVALLAGRGISHDWRSATTLVVTDLVEDEVDGMIGTVQVDATFVVDRDGTKRLPDPNGDVGPIAALVARSVAFVIDAVLTSIAWWFALASALNGSSAGAGSRLLGLAVLAVYYVGFVGVTGQTPGKMAMRLRIVAVDTGRLPGWSRSIVRFVVPNAVWIVTLLFGLSGPWDWVWALAVYGVVLLGPGRRGLHDLAAGTMVVGSRPA